MPVVGWGVVVAGCGFVVAGLAQLVLTLCDEFVRLRRPAPEPSTSPIGSHVAGLPIHDLADLASALSKLPAFALAPAIGLIMIAVGQRLIAGALLLSY